MGKDITIVFKGFTLSLIIALHCKIGAIASRGH